MDWQETAAMVGLFALRIVIPLVVTLGIGELISRRYSARQQAAAPQSASAACDGYEFSPHCWEVKNCDPAIRETCPAYLRPQIPCWLAIEVAGRELPEECFACEVFNRVQSVATADITGVQGG